MPIMNFRCVIGRHQHLWLTAAILKQMSHIAGKMDYFMVVTRLNDGIADT